MYKALTNGVIFTGYRWVNHHALLVEGEKIKDIVPEGHVPKRYETIDCHGDYIAPGLIDLQIYGGGGVLFSDDPSPAFLKRMAEGLVATGTTSFLITLATNSMEIFKRAIQVVKENPHPAVLGLHFEGPYLNTIKSGAHLKQFIKKAEVKEVEELLAAADGVLKMMTLAPELCSDEVLALLKANKVVLSAGHSNASYEEGIQGFEKGFTAATHLFNAMSALHHRDTGLPGAVFHSDACASIIADGIHVDYQALKMGKQLMGKRLFLITDAVEESSGPYRHVRSKDRYTLEDGTLSGSMLSLLSAIGNCVNHAGIALDEAIRMASLYPAKVIGNESIGHIAPGNAADLLVFDRAMLPKKVFSKGVLMER